MKKRLMVLVLIFSFMAGITACGGGYYMIKDPATSSVYYTTDYDEQKSGALKFTDAKSGDQVTIQNSEISKISKDEYKKATQPEEKE